MKYLHFKTNGLFVSKLAKFVIIIVGLIITTNINSMEKDSLQLTYSSEELEEVTEFIKKNGVTSKTLC